MNIAIDGTSASGKSSISRAVAQKLCINYLNTGAIYRAYALYCIRKNYDPKNAEEIDKIIEEVRIEIKNANGFQITKLNNEDVTSELNSTVISETASILAQNPKIRDAVKKIQRTLANECDVLIEGRDIGTEILPDADFKFFITASLEERAKRRYLDLKESKDVTYEGVYNALKERDEKDRNRLISPLKQAEDAILIDNTNLTLQQSIDLILNYITGRV